MQVIFFRFSVILGSLFVSAAQADGIDCQKYKTNEECPAYCIWKCDDSGKSGSCIAPKCEDYPPFNLLCPDHCLWSCEKNACESLKTN